MITFFIEPEMNWMIYEDKRAISGLEIIFGLNSIWVLVKLTWELMKKVLNKLKTHGQ